MPDTEQAFEKISEDWGMNEYLKLSQDLVQSRQPLTLWSDGMDAKIGYGFTLSHHGYSPDGDFILQRVTEIQARVLWELQDEVSP